MKNVLIIEDDPMVSLINRKYIEFIKDFKVIDLVYTEEEVLKVLDREKIDLILLDYYLPKQNGLEILKTIRNKGCLADVIMITAANSAEEVKAAFAYGVIDYLIKPFEFDRFKEAINKYISKHKLLKENKNLEQKELDILSQKEQLSIEVPKGLSKKTLEKVIELLEKESSKQWTIREISECLGISNVSIKKYMDHLEKIKKVKMSSSYGNVGRPEYKYTLNF